jgi:hypothetical protein
MLVHGEAGTLRIRIEGDFGQDDSRRLAEAARALGPVARLVVDFAGVHECRDASLALLASTLASLPGDVAVSGLTRHQARVLRYLGVKDVERA